MFTSQWWSSTNIIRPKLAPSVTRRLWWKWQEEHGRISHLMPKVTSMRCLSAHLAVLYGTGTKWQQRTLGLSLNIWPPIMMNGRKYLGGRLPMPRRMQDQKRERGLHRPVSPVWTHSWLKTPRRLYKVRFRNHKKVICYIITNLLQLVAPSTPWSVAGVAILHCAILVSFVEFNLLSGVRCKNLINIMPTQSILDAKTGVWWMLNIFEHTVERKQYAVDVKRDWPNGFLNPK